MQEDYPQWQRLPRRGSLSLSKKYRSFRTSPQAGVGIPRLGGKCDENFYEKLGDCHASVSTGSQ